MDKPETKAAPVNTKAFLREVLQLVCSRPIVDLVKFKDVKINPDARSREPFKSLLNNSRQSNQAVESEVVVEDLAAGVDSLAIQSRVRTRSDHQPTTFEPTFLPHEPVFLPPNLLSTVEPDEDSETGGRQKKTRKKPRTRKKKTQASPTIEKSNKSEVQTLRPVEASSSQTDGDRVQSTKKPKNKKKKTKKDEEVVEKFEDYENETDVIAGLKDGTLAKGEIRVNTRNSREAYIADATGTDIMIRGIANRNRALDGDVVVVRLEEESEWVTRSSEEIQRTGKVVFIREKVHNRVCIGTLLIDWKGAGSNSKCRRVKVMPVDPRLPRLRVIPEKDPLLVKLLKGKKRTWDDCLVHCQIGEWEEPKYALGSLVEVIGKKGNVEVEAIAAFRAHGLDDRRLSKDILSPHELEMFTLTDEEINKRLDLRKECIFSIDPPTARDLDDALSIKKLEDDLYEVGVHISDVSHYIEYGSCLDCEASRRATSIYLVDSVIHMLPVELCLHCSLLPGQDKLAFSVIWKMDSEGNILDTKIAKTIVNSCAQLSYDHAQGFIDGTTPNLPAIHNGFTESEIKWAIENLHSISRRILNRRFENGSLRINQPKTCVKLDENRVPVDVFVYEVKESNSLIEEFMLQANQSVAEVIIEAYPKLALLRRHAPPKKTVITRIMPKFKKLGIQFSADSSYEFNSSLEQIKDNDQSLVVRQWCANAMKRAEYFCDEEYTHHYALCFDLYTHFTSPIRRYADVVVHRVLAAAIGYSPMPDWDTEEIQKHAETSNVKKYSAKKMGDDHIKLYVAEYIRLTGPIEAEGIVFQINKNSSLNVLVKKFGLTAHVVTDDILGKTTFNEDDGLNSLKIEWTSSPDMPVVLTIFSPVRLMLKVDKPNDLSISWQLIQ